MSSRKSISTIALVLCATSAALFSNTSTASSAPAATATGQKTGMTNELKYGDRVYLQNGYSGWQGGYLDTNGHGNTPGSKYSVSTANTPTRGPLTGTWEILSATGTAAGAPVLSGDLVYMHNLYGGDGGYLDTNGHATTDQQTAGGKFDVKTSPVKDRAPGTGRWRVYARTSSPQDKNVRFNDVVHLWNAYSDNGGFLETNGLGPAGGKYDVCTNAYWNRSGDVANWRFLTAQA